MTRPRIRAVLWLLVVAAAAVSLAGCGGSGGGDATSTESTSKAETTTTEETVTAPGWAGEVLAEPGPESAAVMAGSDFAVGKTRVSFLLVREDGSLLRRKEALVTYRPDPTGPVHRTVAKLVDIGVDPSKADADEVKQIYVATLQLTRPGKQWIVIEPVKAAFQGFQILDVKAKDLGGSLTIQSSLARLDQKHCTGTQFGAVGSVGRHEPQRHGPTRRSRCSGSCSARIRAARFGARCGATTSGVRGNKPARRRAG